jgi:hypothetical protein
MAHLNAHYDNSAWLTSMGENLADIGTDKMILTLDVVGRRFRLDPAKLLRIGSLADIAAYLQEEETSTGLGRIIAVAERVREIYDMAFPRGGATGPEGADANQAVQQVQPAETDE